MIEVLSMNNESVSNISVTNHTYDNNYEADYDVYHREDSMPVVIDDDDESATGSSSSSYIEESNDRQHFPQQSNFTTTNSNKRRNSSIQRDPLALLRTICTVLENRMDGYDRVDELRSCLVDFFLLEVPIPASGAYDYQYEADRRVCAERFIILLQTFTDNLPENDYDNLSKEQQQRLNYNHEEVIAHNDHTSTIHHPPQETRHDIDRPSGAVTHQPSSFPRHPSFEDSSLLRQNSLQCAPKQPRRASSSDEASEGEEEKQQDVVTTSTAITTITTSERSIDADGTTRGKYPKLMSPVNTLLEMPTTIKSSTQTFVGHIPTTVRRLSSIGNVVPKLSRRSSFPETFEEATASEGGHVIQQHESSSSNELNNSLHRNPTFPTTKRTTKLPSLGNVVPKLSSRRSSVDTGGEAMLADTTTGEERSQPETSSSTNKNNHNLVVQGPNSPSPMTKRNRLSTLGNVVPKLSRRSSVETGGEGMSAVGDGKYRHESCHSPTSPSPNTKRNKFGSKSVTSMMTFHKKPTLRPMDSFEHLPIAASDQQITMKKGKRKKKSNYNPTFGHLPVPLEDQPRTAPRKPSRRRSQDMEDDEDPAFVYRYNSTRNSSINNMEQQQEGGSSNARRPTSPRRNMFVKNRHPSFDSSPPKKSKDKKIAAPKRPRRSFSKDEEVMKLSLGGLDESSNSDLRNKRVSFSKIGSESSLFSADSACGDGGVVGNSFNERQSRDDDILEDPRVARSETTKSYTSCSSVLSYGYEATELNHKQEESDYHHKQFRVRFDFVHIRSYEQILSDNPCCRHGPSVGIGWDYVSEESMDINMWENMRNNDDEETGRRHGSELLLSCAERESIVLENGYTAKDIARSLKHKLRIKNQRSRTVNTLKARKIEYSLEKMNRKVAKINRKVNKYIPNTPIPIGHFPISH